MSKKFLNKILCVIAAVLLQSTFFAYSFNDNTPRVLIVRLRKTGTIDWGGVSTHTLTLYKKLLEIGISAHILVPKDSPLEKKLQAEGLPFFTFTGHGPSSDDADQTFDNASNAYKTALEICQRYDINILHINFFSEIAVANELRSALEKSQKINIVFQQHGVANHASHSLAGISAFISFDKASIHCVEEQNLGIKSIRLLPPITQINKDNKIDESLSRNEFFQKRFNITIPPKIPVLCCVGHFFTCKNHEGLFKAVHKLMYAYKTPVHLVLAGKGEQERTIYLKQMAKSLGIQDKVSFLGFVPNVQELLFYSDIKVLVSKKEPFGLAVIEAALMKKPVVISNRIGIADAFIIHNQTGLLCNPCSPTDIALQIKYLIKNKAIAQRFGQAAYDVVKDYYSSNGLVLEYLNIYKEIS